MLPVSFLLFSIVFLCGRTLVVKLITWVRDIDWEQNRNGKFHKNVLQSKFIFKSKKKKTFKATRKEARVCILPTDRMHRSYSPQFDWSDVTKNWNVYMRYNCTYFVLNFEWHFRYASKKKFLLLHIMPNAMFPFLFFNITYLIIQCLYAHIKDCQRDYAFRLPDSKLVFYVWKSSNLAVIECAKK